MKEKEGKIEVEAHIKSFASQTNKEAHDFLKWADAI
jgi:hypothetical protein